VVAVKLLRVVPWLALLAACSFPPLDLEGRECPCLDGWSCNADNICVRGSADAGMDAGSDGGTVIDAALSDAGLRDAASSDAFIPAEDASPDGGPLDAGPCHEVIVPIAGADDEGQFEYETWEPDGPDSVALHCGWTQGTEPIDQPLSCYFRFALPSAIPAGATDVELFLELGAAGSERWDPLR
jgi:hypothetical protein